MKMLTIINDYIWIFSHTYRFNWFILDALAALKYETAIFQESLGHRIGHMLIW